MRLIDADELKAKVEAMVEHKVQESDYDYSRNQTLDYVADILIEDAPTIYAEPVKHGEWKCMADCGATRKRKRGRGMTREEAINTLGNLKRYISGGGVTDGGAKVKEFIKDVPKANKPRKILAADDLKMILNGGNQYKKTKTSALTAEQG